MYEFAIIFDGGAWTVMKRFVPGGEATRLCSVPTFERAVGEIWLVTGAPVLLKVVTEPQS